LFSCGWGESLAWLSTVAQKKKGKGKADGAWAKSGGEKNSGLSRCREGGAFFIGDYGGLLTSWKMGGEGGKLGPPRRSG